MKKRRYKYLAGALLCLAASEHTGAGHRSGQAAGSRKGAAGGIRRMTESGRRGSGKRLITNGIISMRTATGLPAGGKIDDNWYDFGEDGVLQTGRWIDEYYVGTDGRMLDGHLGSADTG